VLKCGILHPSTADMLRSAVREQTEVGTRAKEIMERRCPCGAKRTFQRFVAPLRRIKWVVYCKAPFAGPAQVLRYLSRPIRNRSAPGGFAE
jgi:hypothetical protein